MAAKPKLKPSSAAVPARRAKLAAVPGSAGDAEDSKFDRLVYERVRLGIMSALAVREELTFTELKALFEVSDGNLSAHARKLEEAKYVLCKKGYDGRIPRTEYRLSASGRAALERYLLHMEALIRRVGERG